MNNINPKEICSENSDVTLYDDDVTWHFWLNKPEASKTLMHWHDYNSGDIEITTVGNDAALSAFYNLIEKGMTINKVSNLFVSLIRQDSTRNSLTTKVLSELLRFFLQWKTA